MILDRKQRLLLCGYLAGHILHAVPVELRGSEGPSFNRRGHRSTPESPQQADPWHSDYQELCVGGPHHLAHPVTRRLECRRFLWLYFWKGLSDGISRNANILMGVPIVLVPLARGEPLVVASIFTAFSLVDTISVESVKNLNFGMNVAADYYSVIKRAEQVLLLEEKQKQPQSDELNPPLRVESRGPLNLLELFRERSTPEELER